MFDDGIEREDEWDYLCDHADDGEGFGPDDEDDDVDHLDEQPPMFVVRSPEAA